MLTWFRQRLKRVRLAVRLAVWTSVVLLVAMSGFTAMSLMDKRHDAIEGTLRSIEPMAQTLERMLRVSMMSNHQEEVDQMIQKIGQGDSLENVSLMNHEGTVRYSTDPEAVGRVNNRKKAACRPCHATSPPLRDMDLSHRLQADADAQIARVLLPVYNSNECWSAACHVHRMDESVLGVIEFDVSLTPLFGMLQASRNRMALFTLLMVALSSAVVWLLIQRWVNRPVGGLVEAMRQIAEGNRAEPIPEGETELGYLAGAFNRMSEKLEASQRQLVMSEKLITVGKLTAGVAHELNTPITGILSCAEELLEGMRADDPLREEGRLIQRESLRCREIVKNLLDFGRQQIPEPREVDLREVIAQALALVRKNSRFRNVSIRTEFAKDLPTIKADPGQVEQVFLNILINAADAMPEGGEILIKTAQSRPPEWVITSFTDTGVGIPPEMHEKIFEPFVSTKAKDQKGSGLGLAVCAQIVKSHGGRIEVQSQQGQGTTFSVFFPKNA